MQATEKDLTSMLITCVHNKIAVSFNATVLPKGFIELVVQKEYADVLFTHTALVDMTDRVVFTMPRDQWMSVQIDWALLKLQNKIKAFRAQKGEFGDFYVLEPAK